MLPRSLLDIPPSTGGARYGADVIITRSWRPGLFTAEAFNWAQFITSSESESFTISAQAFDSSSLNRQGGGGKGSRTFVLVHV